MVRVHLRSGRVDTLFHRQPAPRRDPSAPINPYGPRDLTVITADGAIARIAVDEYRVTWRDPDGRIVQGPAGEKRPLYDVIDRSGKLVRRVVLPPDTKVIGFRTGSVYLARFDDVDLMYIQRHAMP